jgi:hypothetical protein
MAQHKWHKEIKAWADGATIEGRDVATGEWVEVDPLWVTGDEYEYRIKPQPKEPQYLYAYLQPDGNYKFGRFNCNYNGQKSLGKIKLEVDYDQRRSIKDGESSA